ncbi:MAG: hypothetical protein BAJATHORv1_90054 [Candidatus Thorarchaeota archaeon]|nr:MAG: hypothetical protein BAJATHORv1_90054 [Candidatus Thorarchaeota archaeon]
MGSSRAILKDKILLILDQMPCHGYDLLHSLSEYDKNIRLTTLYRWLHEMESEGLVESSMEPGLTGPKRRVYSIGPRGEARLRGILKDAIEVVLHFYDAYRGTLTKNIQEHLSKRTFDSPIGRTLIIAIPRLKEQDMHIVQYLVERNNGGIIETMGDTSILRKYDIKHRSVKGEPQDMPISTGRYKEIWLTGIPDQKQLPRIIFECKRVLASEGILRIIAPFVFFNEPTEPTLSEFIRVTSVQLFPELGVIEGSKLSKLIQAHFKRYGVSEVFPGLVLFWAENT